MIIKIQKTYKTRIKFKYTDISISARIGVFSRNRGLLVFPGWASGSL